MKDEIVKWRKDTGDLIKQTLNSLAEGITGMAASDRKELALSVGYIFQSLRKGEFLSRLSKEWDAYRDKGRIKDDYIGTEQHQACIGQLLEALDRDNPDEVKFNLLKKIFIVSATETKSNRESVLPQQYMALARKLTSGEVLVLECMHKIVKRREIAEQDIHHDNWKVHIATKSGLQHKEFVTIHTNSLIEKGLFMPPHEIASSTGTKKEHFYKYYFLTSLGWAFCEYIDAYENDITDK